MNIALKSSGDRKVKFRENQRNTFGLLPGPEGTCPMATTGKGGCRCVKPGRKNPTCYVYNIMTAYGAVEGVLKHNTDLLRSLTPQEKIRVLTDEFKRFRTIELKQKEPQLFYRIHWAGDIYDKDYLVALKAAMSEFPDITFWCYTRMLPYAEWLAGTTPNLILYYSLDKVNLLPGLQAYFKAVANEKYAGNLQICYMSEEDDFAEMYQFAYTQNMLWDILAQFNEPNPVTYPWPKDPPKLRVCPVDAGKLAGEFGCSKCRSCVNKKDGWKATSVWFKS